MGRGVQWLKRLTPNPETKVQTHPPPLIWGFFPRLSEIILSSASQPVPRGRFVSDFFIYYDYYYN